MNILVACEESQRVCLAFREKGHNAFSCDILPCSAERLGFLQGFVISAIMHIINGIKNISKIMPAISICSPIDCSKQSIPILIKVLSSE